MTDDREHPANGPEQEITSEAAEFAAEQAAQTAPEPGEAPEVESAEEAVPMAEGQTAGPEASGGRSAGRATTERRSEESEAPPKLERLQKILAQAGIASRRHAEELITEGRVQVNGQTVTVLGTKADPDRDHIRVDGKLLRGAERLRYFVLNKPRGYVTTVTDPEGRPTVMQFFAKTGERLYPVGRLDYLSEGLLLVTNDGELANKLTRAASRVEKIYLVKVAGQPSEDQLDRLRGGVAIDKGAAGEGKVHTAAASIRQIRKGDNPWYEVILIEGRNRELRKMFEEIGHHVEKIRRVGYGPLVLDVEPGKIRELEMSEVEALRLTAAGKLKPRRPKATRMLPKEAGQSTEQRIEKEAARRGKKFQRPYSREPKRSGGRDDFGSRPPARSAEARPGPNAESRSAFRPGPRSEPRSESSSESGAGPGTRPGRPAFRPDFRQPSREDTRPSPNRGGGRFNAKPGFGARPPRAEGQFRGERPQTGAKPRFDRRPPGPQAGPRGEGPPRGADKRTSDRPGSSDRRTGFGSNRGPNPRDNRRPDRTDNRPAGRPAAESFGRPAASRPRLDIRPIGPDDPISDREKPRTERSTGPRTGPRSGPGTGPSRPRTDGPPRRSDSAPRFRGASGSGRPQGKPFGKSPGGSGKAGFSGRTNRPAFGKPAFGKPAFGKPSFGSSSQGAGPARSQDAGPNRSSGRPPGRSSGRPQGSGASPSRFKKKDGAPRTNRSGPARGGKPGFGGKRK